MCEHNIYPNSLLFQKISIDKTQQNKIHLYRKKTANHCSLETHELVMDFPCLKNRFLAYLFRSKILLETPIYASKPMIIEYCA